jgi:hypothetical protein
MLSPGQSKLRETHLSPKFHHADVTVSYDDDMLTTVRTATHDTPGGAPVGDNEHRQMAETQRLLDRLHNFVKQGGPDARADVRSYLRMCLKAEELRRQGGMPPYAANSAVGSSSLRANSCTGNLCTVPPVFGAFGLTLVAKPSSDSVVIDVERNFRAGHHHHSPLLLSY